MSKKQFFRAVIFLVVFGVIFSYVNAVFSFPPGREGSRVKERFNAFYSLPDHTLDCAYLGASGVGRYWVGPQAYHDYGISTFALSSGAQPLLFIKYMMKETVKHHEPKLFIVDLRQVVKSADSMNDSFIRRVTDNMPFSLNRIQAVNAALDYAELGENEVDATDLSYYIPILKYHSRWDGGITLKNLLEPNPIDNYMGYSARAKVIYKINPQLQPELTSETQPIPKETEDVLVDLLDYCDTLEDVQFLFVASPYPEKADVMRQLNYAMQIVESRGYDTLNFNTQKLYDAVGLSFDTDYHDNHHVNLVGALEYTDYLARYIQERYNLPDHRGDSNYQSWEESYRDYREITAEGLVDLRQRIKEKEAEAS